MNNGMLGFAIGLGLTFLPTTIFFDALNGQESSSLPEQAIRRVSNQYKESVVHLELFSSKHPQRKVGSGVFVSARGEFLTHSFFVDSEKTSVIVEIQGKRLNAKLTGVDHCRGLALLQVKVPKPVKPVKFGTTDGKVGATVVALGKTFSKTSLNVSVGMISARNRLWGKALQTDAKTSPANYGGLLVSVLGQPIGVLCPDSSGQQGRYDSGIGFAITAKDVKKSIALIQQHGTIQKATLGIHFKSSNLYRNSLEIDRCQPGSPADQEGLLVGDRVFQVDGEKVSHLAEFKYLTGRHYPGEKVTLGLIRGGENRKCELVFGEAHAVPRSPLPLP